MPISYETILNLMQEQGSSKISYNSKLTVHEFLCGVMRVGATLDANIVAAALVAVGLARKRYGLSHTLSITALHNASSPKAMRLAVLYASLRDANAELWNDAKLSINVTPETLSELRAINTLHAQAGGTLLNAHSVYAATLGLASAEQLADTLDLDAKRNAIITGLYTFNGERVLPDPDVLISIAVIAGSQFEHEQAVVARNGTGRAMVVLTPAVAKLDLARIRQQLAMLEQSYREQQANIASRTYPQNFSFTVAL